MTDALAHRGPDGSGIYLDGPFAMGHRRLSIIDLDGGRQPLSNEDQTIWVTFNGEIYNYVELKHELDKSGHRFKTDSDTEVIVHGYEQWGPRVVDHLRGMFAFGIWDTRRRELMLARDRSGIKPLYYYRSPSVMAFASELQAFHALDDFDDQIDLQALDIYLHFQYIPAPYSIFKNVRKLPHAHYAVFRADEPDPAPRRYWAFSFRPDASVTESEWCERLDAALRDAVRVHLRSDVPFGAFLSGGIDSSTVVAYMSQLLGSPVRTFSIGYSSDDFDERVYARQVAQQFGTEHTELVVEPNGIELLEEMVRHYGEPFADSSAIPTFYVSKLAADHVKMVLSGDGGDEVFGGYPHHASIPSRYRLPSSRLRKARFRVGGFARQLGLRPALPSPADDWFNCTRYFNDSMRRRLWNTDAARLRDNARGWFDGQFDARMGDPLVDRLQEFDIENFLPYDNLTKVDIASMRYGLEVRVPLLDHKLLEMVAQIPASLRVRQNGKGRTEYPQCTGEPIGKYLLKEVAGQYFARDFLYRKKMGFEVPIRHWFAGPLRGELRDRLVVQGDLADFFDISFVAQIIEQHGHDCDHSWRLWALLFLAEWLRHQKQLRLVVRTS